MRLAHLLTLLCLSLFGCQADGALHAATDQLRECGLLTDGLLRHSPLYTPDRCYDECLAEASCDELEEALCGSSIALLRRCDERCAFTCPDGALVGLEFVCDGVPHCLGGADEVDCATFTCDGEVHPEVHRCDGVLNCRDGSDEVGCGRPTCPDGLPLADHQICNGWNDCTDGSDEMDCVTFDCGNGRTVPQSSRCDGWAECRNGADEEGCAVLDLTCG